VNVRLSADYTDYTEQKAISRRQNATGGRLQKKPKTKDLKPKTVSA
jgi:hypothetical protein